MIIWLASYPKSGNTLVRSMFSAYYFSKEGNFNFELLKNIKQFPDYALFKNLGVNTTDNIEMVKNYLFVQEEINKRDGNSIRFLKTHSTLDSINGYQFTNTKNSLGVIYIVRDPRKVVLSTSNHYQITLDDSFSQLFDFYKIGNKNNILMHVGSWSSNYNSWKEFKKVNKYLLIKYEDLISKPKETFLLMLNFVHELTKKKFVIDKYKLNNVLKTTTFEYLQNLEKQKGFPESSKNQNGKSVKFFKYGNKNTGKNIPDHISIKLQENFKIEMKELGYL